MKTALLLSGGIESNAIAFWLKPDYGVTIDYGQIPAQAEIRASAAICSSLGIQHEIIKIDCSSLGSGDLIGEQALDISPKSEWWPYRNQLLVTLGAMKMVSYDVEKILIGCMKDDGFHKDGTKEFIKKMSAVLQMQEGGIILEAPAIGMTSVELIKESGIPRNILAWSHSCHVSNFACGQCRGCVKHYNVHEELTSEGY